MRTLKTKMHSRRNGAVVVMVAMMMVVLVGMLAFAVDYGWLLKVRTDLQSAADAAALAAVQTLVPNSDGTQDLAAVRTTLRTYVADNLNEQGFNVPDADIEIGRYDPSTVYSSVTLLNNGIRDAVRVTLRRDGTTNSRAQLFFGRVLGVQEAAVQVTATAVLQKPSIIGPGTYILPFAIRSDTWENVAIDDEWSIYGDGKVSDRYGNTVSGNWGTVDIGASNNSTSDLRDQIENGIRQSDMDALYADGRIPQSTHISGSEPMWVNADPGLSSGIKSAVEAIHGEQRLVPIYDQIGGSNGNSGGNGNGKKGASSAGNGNNAEYRIIGWGVVTVVDSNWNGSKNTYVTVRKSQMYNGSLRPGRNSLDDAPVVEGVYSSPVLVQ